MELNGIATNTGEMQRDIEALNEILSECRNNLASVQSEIMELNAMWEGAAKATFNFQFNKDLEFANDIFIAVDSLIDDMSFSRTEYDRCENEVEAIINGISI